ncbi:putative radical SAM enzyme, TIGR03279 family [Malonomonas rubra DSM 5091]|uniref:Putative radical SAM enzyme, TIGR03279 family n=1 Tax=Malonomonas rubra DSM 5091 TaxID=1122189 RepID=A0A1M6DKP3_MALRU|nr:DUF512 domain-containing protein [Malonomonas rubra]SHI73917.1 putative radical SAM enzyme, TIGR03279 family [Malonomonas rubra DSM 5091]
MLRIESVLPGSYAAEFGLDPGDQLLAINRQEIGDLIDYHQALKQEDLLLEVMRQDGELWELELEKAPEEDLGLQLEHPQPLQCGNQCVFCFVHQLPKGMRRSLYIKDEDYRFSYLYGSYITLSNLQEEDFQRIIAQQLSPLYISVHATDDELRSRLLGCQSPPILPLLKRLTDAGIELHTQVVVCPEWNDGDALDKTISDLAAFYPQIASLAVVPVGLTDHRNNLPQLRKLTSVEAGKLLFQIEQHQQKFLEEKGSRFVFVADEIYLQAGAEIPELSFYEDLSQIENGVGLIAQFRQQEAEVLLEIEPLPLQKVTLVTGTSFAGELRNFTERLEIRTGLELPVRVVENRFFGNQVTVTGLLTGADLLAQLGDYDLGDGVLLPEVMLKADEPVLLDDLSIDELGEKLGVPVIAVESSPWGILDGLEELASAGSVIHC